MRNGGGTVPGPLAGLRVLEVATGVAGPYAGRLLAMSGATVVKVEPPAGDPSRVLPVDSAAPVAPSPVFVHLNAGKQSVGPDRADVARTLEWADVVLSDRVRSEFGPWERTGAAAHPPLLASVTAWGTGADRSGEPADELLVQAASGLLAATGDGGAYWRFPGWQSQYLAGAYTAAAVLAGIGTAGHVEVTWVGAAGSAVEAQAAATLYAATSERPDDPAEEQRQAGFQTRTFPSGAFACADGFVVPGTVRGKDWAVQCELYGRPELALDARFGWARRWEHRTALRAELDPWYRSRTRREIFDLALGAGWSAGMVLSAADVLRDEHLADRGFLGAVTGDATGSVIVRPWRSPDRPAARSVRLARRGEDDAWFDPGRPRHRDRPTLPSPSGLRVVELTWAWAGPFVGRFLAALGADVVRIETGAHPDGWRTRFRFSDIGATPGPGRDHDDYTYDGSAQFNALNRSKRAVSVDLSGPAGVGVFQEMVAGADVLVVNMNHRVLVDLGLDAFVAAQVDRGLVHLTMPALGATGPDCAMPGFGMLTEGMGGFAARHGDPAEGARTSPTYYPDAVSGVHGTVAVLAALAGRAAGGRGSAIDLSQQETLWLQFGEAVVLASREGRDPERLGNGEPGVDAGLLSTADGVVAFVIPAGRAAREVDRMLAVDGHADLPGWAAARDSAPACDALRGAGARAEPMRDIRSLLRSGRLASYGMVETVDHPVTGRRAHLGIPVRIDGRCLRAAGPAPMFDQHTDAVMAEWLGRSAGEVRRLRADGVIGSRPPLATRRPGGARP